MNIKLNFHQVDASDSIKQTIHSKSEKLKKFFSGNFNMNWTCSMQNSQFKSHAHVSGKDMQIDAHSERDDLYKTIDDVVEKIQRQLEKKKSISKDHVHKKPTFEDEV